MFWMFVVSMLGMNLIYIKITKLRQQSTYASYKRQQKNVTLNFSSIFMFKNKWTVVSGRNLNKIGQRELRLEKKFFWRFTSPSPHIKFAILVLRLFDILIHTQCVGYWIFIAYWKNILLTLKVDMHYTSIWKY